MQLLPNLLLLAHQLKTGSALRVLDNGLQLPVYGAEEKVVDYAVLASDQKAALPSQVQTILGCFESLLRSSSSFPSALPQLQMLG